MLSAGALPAVHAGQQRPAADAEQRRERAQRQRHELLVRAFESASDRAPRRRTRASARDRPGRGAATSTTATTPRGCRCLRPRARRSPIRSADARRRRAGTRARWSPSTCSGSRRTSAPAARSSSLHQPRRHVGRRRQHHGSTPSVVSSGRSVERARHRTRSRAIAVDGRVEADGVGGQRGHQRPNHLAQAAREAIGRRRLSDPSRRPGARAAAGAGPGRRRETLESGCHASARLRRTAETARAPTADRRRRRECRPAAVRQGRSSASEPNRRVMNVADRFVAVGRRWPRDEELRAHAQLAGEREQPRAHERSDASRECRAPRTPGSGCSVPPRRMKASRGGLVGTSRSPRPSSSQSLMPSGFWTSSESGPASIVKPSTCSLRMTPPARALRFEQDERRCAALAARRPSPGPRCRRRR